MPKKELNDIEQEQNEFQEMPPEAAQQQIPLAQAQQPQNVQTQQAPPAPTEQEVNQAIAESKVAEIAEIDKALKNVQEGREYKQFQQAINAAPPAVGEKQIADATERLLKYKGAKASIDKRIVDNEQFFKLRHWDNATNADGKAVDIKPTAWLWNVILSKHADLMDGFPEPNVLPKEQGDKQEAEMLSSIVPVVLETSGFKKTFSDCSWYKLIKGTAAYGIFWDNTLQQGKGDIAVKKVDILNLFWEPGIKNIQDNKNIVQQVKNLNGKYYQIYKCSNNYIIIAALLDAPLTFGVVDVKCKYTLNTGEKEFVKSYGKYTFERRVPKMDYYCESQNRIWGCRFGYDEESKGTVNEIRCCKQGDPTNWNSFAGIASDSYVLPVGTDGVFTGCINYNGYPLFFKKKYIHKIYGSTPTSYQAQVNSLRGIGEGMAESAVICNNRLYYATGGEIVMYDGAGVYTISAPLGRLNFDTCIAGADQRRLYFKFERNWNKKYVKKVVDADTGEKEWFKDSSEEERVLYVYDTELDMWYEEDCPDIMFFSNDGDTLFFIEKYFDSAKKCDRYRIKSVNESYTFANLGGDWEDNAYPAPDGAVDWFAETGEIGFADPFGKYLQKISLRAKLESDAAMNVYISYDGGEFEETKPTGLNRGVHVKDYIFRIKRCDYFKLRIEGKGKMTLISVYKSYVQGSDKK